jgi:hypothetical protein
MPQMRRQKWPEHQEFWESTEPKEFRIQYPLYSQAKRFKRWLKVRTTYFDSEKEKTIDQILDEKFGEIDCYTDYELKRPRLSQVAAIYHYSPEFFMSPTDKKGIKHDPIGKLI